jgi:GNAT superfamily N-acetyltransferase
VIREFVDSDFPGAALLLQAVYHGQFFTEAGLRHRLETAPERARLKTWCAEHEGAIVGWGRSGLVTDSARDDVGWVAVSVLADHRRRGLGAALYDLAEAHVQSLGARRLLAGVLDEPDARRFAEARGFVHSRTERSSMLDPRDVDLSELHALRRAREAEGFRLVPLEELRDRPRLVFDLDVAASLDMPADEPIADMRFDEWVAYYWTHPDVAFDGSFVVLHGERAVSFALLRADPSQRKAMNDMTGTLREYRGRGLARLAKLATIAWADAQGITEIATDNDETNQPMLRLNVSLGYKPYAAEHSYVRDR